MLGCSNDNSTPTEETISIEQNTIASKSIIAIENSTDKQFSNYVNSDIFIEVNSLIINFNKNLNYLITFETEDQLFTWIETNLSKTNFTSVEQAKNHWQHIVSRKSVEIEQFKEFYKFVANIPTEEAEFYVHKWFPNGLNYTTTDDDCDIKFDNCTRNATNAYVSRSLSMAYTGNTSLQVLSDSMLEVDMERCRRDYRRCAGYN